jgi:hypothetical protein
MRSGVRYSPHADKVYDAIYATRDGTTNPIYADLSTEYLTYTAYESDITIEDDDVTISESTTPSTITHSSDDLDDFGT